MKIRIPEYTLGQIESRNWADYDKEFMINITYENGFFRKLFKLPKKQFLFVGSGTVWRKFRRLKERDSTISLIGFGRASRPEEAEMHRIWETWINFPGESIHNIEKLVKS